LLTLFQLCITYGQTNSFAIVKIDFTGSSQLTPYR